MRIKLYHPHRHEHRHNQADGGLLVTRIPSYIVDPFVDNNPLFLVVGYCWLSSVSAP
jgi:hypothetical protein